MTRFSPVPLGPFAGPAGGRSGTDSNAVLLTHTPTASASCPGRGRCREQAVRAPRLKLKLRPTCASRLLLTFTRRRVRVDPTREPDRRVARHPLFAACWWTASTCWRPSAAPRRVGGQLGVSTTAVISCLETSPTLGRRQPIRAAEWLRRWRTGGSRLPNSRRAAMSVKGRRCDGRVPRMESVLSSNAAGRSPFVFDSLKQRDPYMIRRAFPASICGGIFANDLPSPRRAFADQATPAACRRRGRGAIVAQLRWPRPTRNGARQLQKLGPTTLPTWAPEALQHPRPPTR